MWSESQRESNLRSEKIASEDKQRDGNNAPIKKLVATPVCFRMRTISRQLQWRGQVFHPSNSLLLIDEVGSFMLIKLQGDDYHEDGGKTRSFNCYNWVNIEKQSERLPYILDRRT